MLQTLLTYLHGLPPEWIVAIIAALPLTELRASIPLGIAFFHMRPIEALWYSWAGNAIPIVLLFAFLPFVIAFIEKHIPSIHRILEKHFYHLEEKHRTNYQKYGMLFLIVFVAIPLPGFGVWSGILLSILFRMKYRYSIPAVVIGLILLGLIVLFLTQGSLDLLHTL